MGSTLMGSQKSSQTPLMTPEQQNFLSQILGGAGQQAGAAYQQFLQPQSPEQFQDLYQQSFIDPAMKTYEQQVLPAIQQRFVDAGAGSSSALNQALGQSAVDLTTMLGSQMGNFMQGQQGNQLNALQLLNQLVGQKEFQPIQQQKQGLLGPLIGAGGQLGGALLGGGLF